MLSLQFNLKVLDTEDESRLEQEDKLRKPFHEDEEVDERLKEAISSIQEDLDAIQEQQRIDRNRLSLHSATNRSSHNGVVVDSIVETVVFIMSLLFQVSMHDAQLLSWARSILLVALPCFCICRSLILLLCLCV
mgnify:CR=1 FL=1